MWARLLLNASAVDGTRDVQIFSLALSQLSYRGGKLKGLKSAL